MNFIPETEESTEMPEVENRLLEQVKRYKYLIISITTIVVVVILVLVLRNNNLAENQMPIPSKPEVESKAVYELNFDNDRYAETDTGIQTSEIIEDFGFNHLSDLSLTEIPPKKTIKSGRSDYTAILDRVQHRDMLIRFQTGLSIESYVRGKATASEQVLVATTNNASLSSYPANWSQSVIDYYIEELGNAGFVYTGFYQGSRYSYITEDHHYFVRLEEDLVDAIVVSPILHAESFAYCDDGTENCVNELYNFYYFDNLSLDLAEWELRKTISPSGEYEAIIANASPFFYCDYLRPECLLVVRNTSSGEVYFDGDFREFQTKNNPVFGGWDEEENLVLHFLFRDAGESARVMKTFDFRTEDIVDVGTTNLNVSPCASFTYYDKRYIFTDRTLKPESCGVDNVQQYTIDESTSDEGFYVFAKDSDATQYNYLGTFKSGITFDALDQSLYAYQIGNFRYNGMEMEADIRVSDYIGDLNSQDFLIERSYGFNNSIATGTVSFDPFEL